MTKILLLRNSRVWGEKFEFKLREDFLERAVQCGHLGHQLHISSKTNLLN